ncbi:MAG: class I SAM-dependent rRNA methyltransferase [Acidobacteria bacterium]|jgi:23S rRNA (cytosine1962-C5)-methyltransferase|nr:MAG: class I SAM-dependent rRNA methyltransferase [Acidobacteriota bacterium]GIU82673.1 MAG: SAM-dependent methyltransferase [Pyrinomonadaceae bacterium]
MIHGEVLVNQKGAKRIRNGHLWIYRSDILKIKASGGDVVSVFDEARNFVGKAFYSDASEIALRFFTTHNENINEEFWQKKILQSVARRLGSLELSAIQEKFQTNALRFVNAEGDLIPSLIIDFYNGVFVIQTLSQGTEKLKWLFAEILKNNFSPETIIEKNDASVRLLEKLELKNDVLFGKKIAETLIEQNGLKFRISFLEGQKTGAFLDQRENYLVAKRLAKGKALDCFTFGGGFALNMAANCDEVLAVDISEKAIKLAEENAKLNQIKNVHFRVANVFDFLRELEKRKETFDTIVLDPPSFTKTRQSLERATRGYKEINLRAMKLLNPEGILITCSCSQHFKEELFLETLQDAAHDAKRKLQLIEKRMQSADHSILLTVPETYYLKCFVLRLVS